MKKKKQYNSTDPENCDHVLPCHVAVMILALALLSLPHSLAMPPAFRHSLPVSCYLP